MEDELAIAPTSVTSSIARSRSITLSVTSAVLLRGVSFGRLSVIVICVLSISGIKAVPLEKAAFALIASKARINTNTIGLKRSDSSSTLPYPFIRPLKAFPSFCGFTLEKMPADIAGTTVSAISRLANREKAMVSPISTNNCLTIPSVKTMGRNTHTVVSVEARIAPATSPAPAIAASFAEYPSLRILKIFSITTMELSTSIPTPRARPDREMTFRVTPLKYIHTIAVIRLTGMEQATTAVGRQSLRNRIRISTARTAPNNTLLRIESITRSM